MSENAATSPVRLDRAGAVATVVLDRPEAMNALDVATKESLLQLLREVGNDPQVRCVVLTGTGRAFCAGLDMSNFGKMASGERSGGGSSRSRTTRPRFGSLRMAS